MKKQRWGTAHVESVLIFETSLIKLVPERRLLSAVLVRAITDLNPNVEEHVRRDAINWFTCKEKKYNINVFSFKYIALQLDLDPQALWAAIKKEAQMKNAGLCI